MSPHTPDSNRWALLLLSLCSPLFPSVTNHPDSGPECLLLTLGSFLSGKEEEEDEKKKTHHTQPAGAQLTDCTPPPPHQSAHRATPPTLTTPTHYTGQRWVTQAWLLTLVRGFLCCCLF